MKTSRKAILGLGLPLLVIVVVIAAGLIWRGEYPTEQSAERTFVIEHDFTKVRKIMVRTEASKEIITMGGGSEFVEQQWEGGSANAGGEDFGEKLLNLVVGDPDWQLKLSGSLKVRTLDDYIGKHVITLQQEVEITPDKINSEANLVQGSDRLLGYAMVTRLEREADHTLVTLRLEQEINTDAPWFAHAIADHRVLASIECTLKKQEIAMRELIEKHKDKKWLFPLN